jgi:ABC-type sugar transport system permease subunit
MRSTAESPSKIPVAEAVALTCALVILAALLLPWTPNANGFQLLSQIPANARVFSTLFLIPVAALAALIAALRGLRSESDRHSASVGALVAGVIGLWFFLLALLQNSDLIGSWFQVGFWLALIGAVGLVAQYWLQGARSPAAPNEPAFLGQALFWLSIAVGVWAVLQFAIPMPAGPAQTAGEAAGAAPLGGLTNEAFRDRISMLLLLIFGLGGGTILLEVMLYWFFSRVLHTRHALAFTLLSPAVIALALFTLYPLIYNVQLAFSDLRLKTFPCYMPSGTASAPCPLGFPDVGKTVQVVPDSLALHAEPGDSAQVVSTLPNGASVTVLESGKVKPPASSNNAAAPSSGGFDLGGAALPGQQGGENSGTAQGQAVDERTWWKVRTDSGQEGWVPDTNDKGDATIRAQPVLYSLDYGLRNLRDVFFDVDPNGNIRRDANGNIQWGRLIRTENSTFPVMFARTVLWTVLNVIFHLVLGFALALVMNNSRLRFRGIYRSIILIPWAIPQVIAALTWKAEFHSTYGFVNSMLNQFGLPSVPWLTSPVPAFAAVLFVNVWLGVPFYMVTLLGGLGSISREYYEASEIDGASIIQRFRHITVPLIRPIAVPIVTLDAIWTFNLFNVIFLITGGEPAESTNILVTGVYNAAFGPNGTARLGFAAAFSILIFLILLAMVVVWVRSTNALKGVYD